MLDPNIAMGIKGIQLNDPMEQYGKAMALSQMGVQNQFMQQKMAEQQRVNTLSQMRSDAFRQSGGDPARLRELHIANGDFEALQSHDDRMLATEKTRGEIDSKAAETNARLEKLVSGVAAGIHAGGTIEHGRHGANLLRQYGAKTQAQIVDNWLDKNPNATPEMIQKAVAPYIASQIDSKDMFMPNMEKAGDRLVNTNPFTTTQDIKMGVSPDTLVREQGDDRRAAQGRAANPYFQFLPTADGYRVGDARTGNISIPPNQVIPATADPALQGAIAGAKNTAEMQTKRDHSMKGLGDTITEAENILWGKGQDGKKAPLPTGSGVGTAIDFAGGIVGASPAGSEQAQQLKALSGALTSKMPRMEGPQSDKDVQMYKEMAALIGDSTVPVARRRAALRTVKKLWGKYEKKQNVNSGEWTDL